jgi:hypothetical protein
LRHFFGAAIVFHLSPFSTKVALAASAGNTGLLGRLLRLPFYAPLPFDQPVGLSQGINAGGAYHQASEKYRTGISAPSPPPAGKWGEHLSIALEKGCDLNLVKTLADHSSIKTTSKYVGLVRDRNKLKDAMDLL